MPLHMLKTFNFKVYPFCLNMFEIICLKLSRPNSYKFVIFKHIHNALYKVFDNNIYTKNSKKYFWFWYVNEMVFQLSS